MSGSKFFTNEPDKDLYTRFSKILQSNTQFFDILVGYFRTSGFFKLKDAMQDIEKIRILVGLNVDSYTVKLIDTAKQEVSVIRKTEKEGRDILESEIQNEFADAPVEESIESGVRTFIEWLKSGKLEMRMYTEAPLHSKVYIMRKSAESDVLGSVITGSSNFSMAGLQNHLEFNVELRDDDDVRFATDKFEELWNDGIDVRDTYLEAVEQKTWLKDDITPYEIYLKTLYEFFKEEINADKDKLANDIMPDDFMRLQYQVDAVVQAKKILETHGGVFISDVVGLGKTFICAMLARTLRKGKKLIICPPVLVDYWRNTLLDFDVAATVESLGKLDNLLEKGVDDYSYVFIDEAHRFRNDRTEGYSKLFEICNGKKVVLISATPINNYAKDIQSQLYLFEPKFNSTIAGVKNLEAFFRKLNNAASKYAKDTPEHLEQLRINSEEIRNKILRQVMIRRTRGEIEEFYKTDLEKQGLSFPKLGSPQQILYEFDAATDAAFTETINAIKTFKYSRYKALIYLVNPDPRISSLLVGAQNMGGFMKGILVKRLESSFYAFKMTLDRFVESYEKFIKMFESGEIWVSKKVNVFDLIDSGNTEKLLQLEEDEDAMHFKSIDFQPWFIRDLHEDLTTLKYLQSLWKTVSTDPKLEQFVYELNTNDKLGGEKKIIFTESKETADYLKKELTKVYGDRVVAYSGSSKLELKQKIEDSFNPKYKHKNNNKYDILITTDVLAEGVNLHRANALINYDLPWNPTRIMQRVGRINRVGTEHEEIYVFNFFPTSQSSKHLSLEKRVMEKLQAFHDTLGEDYKYLSDDEIVSPQGLFDGLNKNLNEEEGESVNPELSYLAKIREIRDTDPDKFETIKNLPKKAKTGRNCLDLDKDKTITFLKKGAYKTFYMNGPITSAELSFLEAIKYIECSESEPKIAIGKDYYQHAKENNEAFDNAIAFEHLDVVEKPTIKGNDAQVLKILKSLKRVKTFTEEQEEIINKLTNVYEEGNVAKAYSANIMKEMKDVEDPVEAFYVIANNIPESILETKKVAKQDRYEGKKEVILSEYLVSGK